MAAYFQSMMAHDTAPREAGANLRTHTAQTRGLLAHRPPLQVARHH
jgi:hypothetical protein